MQRVHINRKNVLMLTCRCTLIIKGIKKPDEDYYKKNTRPAH